MQVKVLNYQRTGRQAAEMQVGDIAEIFTSPLDSYNGKHVFRTYSGWVCLERPGATWTNSAPSFEVDILPKGTQLTLTIE